jgi:hypothetical protein
VFKPFSFHLGLAEDLLVVLVPGGGEGEPALRGVGPLWLEADLAGGLGGEGEGAVEPGDDGCGPRTPHLAAQARHRPLDQRLLASCKVTGTQQFLGRWVAK